MKNQLKYTEDILFNNYMVSGLGDEYVHSQIPFFFDEDMYKDIKYYGEEINRIALDILKNINGKHKDLLQFIDDFPYKDKIFSLKCELSPMFWTRYDTFIDEDNNIYFSEFNYDKPCGQKEIHLAEKCRFKGNVNEGFIEKLKDFLLKICNEYAGNKKEINVGFLMDPCHYEELHHSYYFKDIFKDSNINIVPVGNNNLSVKDGYVYGFSKVKLDVILKLFPTEFYHEVRNIEEVLDSFNEGKVLLLNDPRIIAVQAKSLFSYLWTLVNEDSHLLSRHDKDIIRKCIPYTEILTKENAYKAIDNRENYVIKSSLGRYSQEVYIGEAYYDDEWEKQISLVLNSNKIHILQNLINIRQEYTYAPDYNNTNVPILAYGNFGLYIMDNEATGILVRWGTELLTNDYYTWMSPIGQDNYSLRIEKSSIENRDEFYEKLNEELSFKYEFTGAYTNKTQYISLDRMVITEDLYEEMESAASEFCRILKKIYPSIQKNLELFGPILDINENLYKIIENSCIAETCAVGRIDFAVDNLGNLKILEFNSETPAGLVESMSVNPIIKETLDLSSYRDPNINLRENIKTNLKNILKEIESKKTVKNIAVVTSWYYEDIYNTKVIAEILKEFNDYNIVFGNIYDMKMKNGKIYLYNEEIHAVYRYYPLDWFYEDEDMRKFIDIFSKEEYLINPAHTLITQSKAFFAVLYGLIGTGILSKSEEEFIKKYIPYTTLEKDNNLSYDYLVKPYLSREGQGVFNNYENYDKEEEYIFQDRVNIRPLRYDEYSTINKEKKFQFPIIGGYVSCDKLCGLYTRMGEIVTDATAKYISTYIK